MDEPRTRLGVNRFLRQPPGAGVLPAVSTEARAFHRALPGYAPTPLLDFPQLARELGVHSVRVKDESKRFGLNAFKALGASYAIYRHLKSQWKGPPLSPANFLSKDVISQVPPVTFTTATDGNHGRAVAWTAAKLHQKAVIYVPGNTSAARIAALKAEGAEVVVEPGTYDEAVIRCAGDAERLGRQIISDTGWEGYTQIPKWIMEGYGTLFQEAHEQLAASKWRRPSAVFLQAGVGGLAYAGATHYRQPGGPDAILYAVEPLDADCLRESIGSPAGNIQVARGKQNSIMAGLNCGTPSLVAWPLIRDAVELFLAVDDDYAREAMQRLASGAGGDPKLVSGESGAAGLAGLLALQREESYARLKLDAEADVLLISTEGATDPASYQQIVGHPP
jgi:diaminopropionate ammonia-lyase